MDPSDLTRQRERQAAWVLGIFGVPLVLALALGIFSRLSGRRSAPSLVMIPSDSRPQQPSAPSAPVTGVQAVDAKEVDQRLLSAGATTGGDVEVSLAWNGLTDLDLEVRDPSGEQINGLHLRSASGGVQDVDANPTPLNQEGERRFASGQNPGPENVLPVPDLLIDLDKKLKRPDAFPGLEMPPGLGHFTRTPVEHVYYARAPRGLYTVLVRCFYWREPDSTPLPFTVQIRSRGKVFYETSGARGPASYITADVVPTRVCEFSMP
jgi:hypothetical protein